MYISVNYIYHIVYYISSTYLSYNCKFVVPFNYLTQFPFPQPPITDDLEWQFFFSLANFPSSPPPPLYIHKEKQKGKSFKYTNVYAQGKEKAEMSRR